MTTGSATTLHPPSGRARPAAGPCPIWTLALWGLGRRPLDVAATVLTALLLLSSRLFLLPSGPWEWDETLFARGILRFDLHAHFPHPPGFPLWLLLGWLALPMVGEPLRALQLLSALASCASLWPLAALGRRAAPAPVAAAASVALLLAPGVWLHAVRGFSSTPAAFLALWAAALAVGGLAGRRLTAFTLLVTAAFLVRPILLPPLALLWLAGVARIHPLRRLVPGVLLGSAAVGAALVGMALAQGSWHRLLRAFATHGATHARNLVLNAGGIADLGMVKGLGGVWPASALAVLVLLGLAAWWRRAGPRQAVTWLVILATGIAEIVWLQNRTFPRYAVPLQLALAPLVAAGAATVAPPLVASAALAGFSALLAGSALPSVREQHQRYMPGWEALLTATRQAARRGLELVIEPGLYPFFSYLEEVARRGGSALNVRSHLAPASPDATTRPSGPYLLVTDFPGRYLAPPFGRSWRWSAVSEALRPLTQGRFLDAAVVEGTPLPLHGWWPLEVERSGERSIWGQPGAALLLPPYPAGTFLCLDLCPAPGPAPLVLLANGREVRQIPGQRVRQKVWIEPAWVSSERTNTLVFQRAAAYPPGPHDPRRLAVRLFGVRGISAALPWEGPMAEPSQRETLAIRAEGLFGPENFPHGRGAWTGPTARLRLPASPGSLSLRVWAPRPEPPDVVVLAGGRRVAGPLKVWKKPTDLEFPIPAEAVTDHSVELVLHVTPYVPAKAGRSRDSRELGIVLSFARFRPASAPPRTPGDWLVAGGPD